MKNTEQDQDMHPDDLQRELEKVNQALDAAEEYLVAYNRANALLHMNSTVLHSPLTLAVINARTSVDKIRAHLGM